MVGQGIGKLVACVRATLGFKFDMNTIWERTDYSNNMVGCLPFVRWQRTIHLLQLTNDLSTIPRSTHSLQRPNIMMSVHPGGSKRKKIFQWIQFRMFPHE